MGRIGSAATASAALAFAACMSSTSATEPEQRPGLAGVCNADPAQRLIGRQIGDEVDAEALRLTGGRVVRRIAPGQSVTMDYRTDRVNIEHDANGRITAIRCG